MDRHTRKDLKTDKFAVEVTHTVEYLGEHRQAAIRYGGIALALILLGAGYWFWSSRSLAERQVALGEALRTQNAIVGSASNDLMKSFPSETEKRKAVEKEFGDIAAKYSGSNEAQIANYMLGLNAAEQGKLPEAEKFLKTAIDAGKPEYAGLARLSLSEVYASMGKSAEAEKILRDLMANPTTFVSKEQAAIALARLIAPKNLAEAQKILDPLRAIPGAPGQAAMNAYTEISKK